MKVKVRQKADKYGEMRQTGCQRFRTLTCIVINALTFKRFDFIHAAIQGGLSPNNHDATLPPRLPPLRYPRFSSPPLPFHGGPGV